MQQELAQQSALAQIPDPVKRVRPSYLNTLRFTDVSCQFIIHFHQAVVNNNLQEISVAYESGWNRLTEKFFPKTEWPEAEIIAPLVDNGAQ